MANSNHKFKIGNEVKNDVPTPTANEHAVNKGYVDGAGASVTVSASRNFLQSDHKKILMVSATVVLTMPSTGLSDTWNTDIDCLATGQATIQGDGGAVVLDSPHGKILEANKMGTVYRKPVGTAANEYRLRGEFKV